MAEITPKTPPNIAPETAPWFEPGTLQEKVTEQTKRAIGCGALLSLPTDYELVEQQDVRFLVRILLNLVRKDEAKQQANNPPKHQQSSQPFNPFLPYEEELFVTHLSKTHLCLLNKYNVVNHHILIVTRAFENQENLLNLQDFVATWTCLVELDGLAFYNGGKAAGASQSHKHLQLVPYLISPEESQIPIEALLTKALLKSANSQEPIVTIPELPFVHAFTAIDSTQLQSLDIAAITLLESYYALLQAVGLQPDLLINGNNQPGPYNLLLTQRWMLLIPRSQESYATIQVNSLGFAGALLVRNFEQMQQLKTMQPLTLLSQVGVQIAI